MDAPVGEDHQGVLLTLIEALRDEGVRPENHGVARPLGGGVGDIPGRRPRHPHLVDDGDVPEPVIP